MFEIDRHDLVPRDDKTNAELGNRPQLLRKILRGSDAAMRGRMARQHALVQGHARPGDALHERHRSAAVDVRMVVAVLLDDAEHAPRSRVTWHAGRDGALRDPHAVAVERHFLRRYVDGNLQRTLWHVAETGILLRLRALAPGGVGYNAEAAGGNVAVPPALREKAQATRVGIRRACQSDDKGHGHCGNKSAAQGHERIAMRKAM